MKGIPKVPDRAVQRRDNATQETLDRLRLLAGRAYAVPDDTGCFVLIRHSADSGKLQYSTDAGQTWSDY